jgi:hypothetical protein
MKVIERDNSSLMISYVAFTVKYSPTFRRNAIPSSSGGGGGRASIPNRNVLLLKYRCEKLKSLS